jgi:hypothetical protein
VTELKHERRHWITIVLLGIGFEASRGGAPAGRATSQCIGSPVLCRCTPYRVAGGVQRGRSHDGQRSKMTRQQTVLLADYCMPTTHCTIGIVASTTMRMAVLDEPDPLS